MTDVPEIPESFEDKTISPYAQRLLDERDKVINGLLAEIATLKAEIEGLKKRLGLNSANSSLPPSSDGLKKKKQ
jgi:Family of unknown function (DUF6444)